MSLRVCVSNPFELRVGAALLSPSVPREAKRWVLRGNQDMASRSRCSGDRLGKHHVSGIALTPARKARHLLPSGLFKAFVGWAGISCSGASLFYQCYGCEWEGYSWGLGKPGDLCRQCPGRKMTELKVGTVDMCCS